MSYQTQTALEQQVWGWLARAWIAHLDTIAPHRSDIWPRSRKAAAKATLGAVQITRGHIKTRAIIDNQTYQVLFDCQWWPAASWKPLIEALKSLPQQCMELERGEITPAFAHNFAASGLLLFPPELSGTCTCSGAIRLCSHAIISLYLLAQSFDREPSLILRLNGMTIQELLRRLETTPQPQQDIPERLTHTAFWFGSDLPPGALPQMEKPLERPGAILQRGYLPPTSPDYPTLIKVLDPLYKKAVHYGHQQRWPTPQSPEEQIK